MTLAQVINVAHQALCEGLDEDGLARVDKALMGEKLEPLTREEAFVKARQRRPRSGAPESVRGSGPPPMPAGYKLAPEGVQVREPEPTRGLDHLHRALGKQG